MTINNSTVDRITLVGLAMVGVLPFLVALSPAPAYAGTVDCAAQAAAVRSQIETADPKVAARALKTVRIAEKICAEGGSFEASKKFAQARAQVDTGVQLAARR
ncbi:hypothetical protein [Sandarakinorhabdus sp.]|uniref:hypothetical protein n=1 Tax=Sandarakinorhabdus sp. TaxID=1916663 RepID=UPI00333E36C6